MLGPSEGALLGSWCVSIKIPDIEERKDHIIKNMIYIVELRPENTEKLIEIFGENAKSELL